MSEPTTRPRPLPLGPTPRPGKAAVHRRILRPGEARASEVTSFVAPSGPGAAPLTVADRIDQARRAGREEGYQAALGEVAAAEAAGPAGQLRRVADALVAAAAAVTAARVEAVQVAATEAAELAVQLAEALVQHELEGRNGVADALRRALAIAPDDEQAMELRIHPGDAISEVELRAIAPGIALTVIGDPRVEPGGCVLTAGPCRIDAQIGPAVARARAALAGLYPGAPLDGDRSDPVRAPAAGALGPAEAPVLPRGRVA